MENDNMTEKMTPHEKVLEFYKAFQQEQHIPSDNITASLEDDVISEERLHLKMSLIAEEFIELVEAVYGKKSANIMEEAWAKAKLEDEHNRDIIETADALGDLVYVIEGLAIEAGIPSDEVFTEIHSSNMSKLDDEGNPILSDGINPAPDGKIKPIGKILKGKNYFNPDIASILKKEK